MKVYTHLMTALVTATLALAATSALAGKTYD